jgi:hypothetical protein
MEEVAEAGSSSAVWPADREEGQEAKVIWLRASATPLLPHLPKGKMADYKQASTMAAAVVAARAGWAATPVVMVVAQEGLGPTRPSPDF